MASKLAVSLLFCWSLYSQLEFSFGFQISTSLQSTSFIASRPNNVKKSRNNNCGAIHMAATYDQCMDVGYIVSVPKPLGVVFGENANPYYGVTIDDVSEGLNGGKAGLRVGDQLLAVNGEVVVGKDFDSILGLLQEAPASFPLELVFYRGTVSMLFTTLANRLEEGQTSVSDYGDDEGEEEVLMDDDYEPPVIEFEEEKPLTAGDVFKALGKLGSMVMSSDDENTPKQEPPKKKNTGFFGIGAETIQLDGDDAKGTK